MERCFVINLGFHADVGLRRITDSAAKSGEKIIVVSGPENPSSAKAIAEFNLYAAKVGMRDKDVKSIHFDLDKPWESIVKFSELIHEECEGRELVLELGGGMRGVAVLILLSALTSNFRVSIESTIEGTPNTLKVPWGFIEFLKKGVYTKDGEILEALAMKEGASTKEIASLAGCGEKTVVNRISKLKKMGLIEKKGRGVPSLTPWGKAAAQISALLKRKE